MKEDFDESIKSDFLQETSELLEELETIFLSLEQNPSDRKIFDHIFRLVHTIKGSAYSTGFEDLGSFAHMFETFLDMARDGRLECNPPMIELMLRSNDQLKIFVDALRKDIRAVVDTAELVSELSLIIGDDLPKKWTGPAFGFFDDESSASPVLATKSAPLKPERKHSLNLRSVQQPVILVCDDDVGVVDVIKDLITGAYPNTTLQVITAHDGEEGVRKMHEYHPHLVISDLRMPKLNGIEFITALRKHDKIVPVMVLSGFAERSDMIEFIKLGVADYLDKPLRQDVFLGRVQRLLHLAQIREAITRLSVLNFRTHMNSVRLFSIQNRKATDVEDQKHLVEEILDEIATLTNFTLTM